MKLSIPAGTTSKRVDIFIQDSSSSTGAGLTGLTNASGSLTCYSHIDTDGNAGGTSQALQSATLGSWTTRGFKEKDATNMPGIYEFGIPDALIAAGVKWAVVMLKGATNMAPCVFEIEVTATSNQDGVHGGMSALPNTAVTTNASLLTSGTGTDQLSVASGLVNVGKINSIATTSVTTVAAVIGTTIAPIFTSSLMKVDVTDWNGSAVVAPNTSGVPVVDVLRINNVLTSSVTTVAAVIGTTIAPTFTSSLMKVDVTDWNGTAVTAPNTAGTPVVDVGRVNNVVTTPVTTIKAVWGLAVDGVVTTVTNQLTAAAIATGVWQDATAGDFTAANSVGKSVMNGVALGTGLTIAAVSGAVGSVTGAVGSVTGNVGGNVVGSVASVTGAVGSVTAAVAITSNVKKNQALAKFQFLMTDSTTHAPKTGVAVTVKRSIDGGAFASGTLSAVTEIANGTYTVDFGAGDVNGNVIVLQATGASSDTTFERIVTQP